MPAQPSAPRYEPSAARTDFHGWRVVAAAFAIAILGWGLGFYGPPVFLHEVCKQRGWPVGLVSAAVTLHYLCGAVVVANLPALYRRFGLKRVTRAGAVALALGLVGWATAPQPWALFGSTLLTGGGWVALGAAAINAMIAPWFVRDRPKALSTAYNGASVGGIVFSPLWVVLIAWLGFAAAAAVVGMTALALVWLLTRIAAVTPESLGQAPDGDPAPPSKTAAEASRLSGGALWSDWRFRTLAAGMALGLFAQIGLMSHLFSLIAPALGESGAGILAGLAAVSAILGRSAFGWLMPPGADRRNAASASYAVQIAGVGLLLLSGLDAPLLIVAGALLFGFGVGNATSLPPLIAQAEFAKADAARAVPLIIATAQAAYAFSPAAFGLLREWGAAGAQTLLLATMGIMLLAAASLQLGRRAAHRQP